MEDNYKDWMHTGETITGLQIWIKQTKIEGTKYLQYMYKKNDGEIVVPITTISFSEVKLLKSLVDNLEMNNGVD